MLPLASKNCKHEWETVPTSTVETIYHQSSKITTSVRSNGRPVPLISVPCRLPLWWVPTPGINLQQFEKVFLSCKHHQLLIMQYLHLRTKVWTSNRVRPDFWKLVNRLERKKDLDLLRSSAYQQHIRLCWNMVIWSCVPEEAEKVCTDNVKKGREILMWSLENQEGVCIAGARRSSGCIPARYILTKVSPKTKKKMERFQWRQLKSD